MYNVVQVNNLRQRNVFIKYNIKENIECLYDFPTYTFDESYIYYDYLHNIVELKLQAE